MYRSCLLLAVLALLVSVAPARAGGGGHAGGTATIVPAGLAGAPLLTEWWREPLAKSADDPTHPFFGGGCRPVGHAIALMYPVGHCTIRQGTWLFAVGISVECSNVEDPPFHADTPLEAALCGLRESRVITEATLTVDGAKPFSVLEPRFGTFMLPGRVRIPPNPIFGGTPGEIMRYGGYGYVAFIRSLPVGEHTLHTHFEANGDADFDATITVRR